MWSLLLWETPINIFKHVNKLNSSYSINLLKYEVGWQQIRFYWLLDEKYQ